MDYKSGKTYCILNNINSEVYVGSTCSMLSKRMHEHRVKANSTKRTYGSKAPTHQAIRALGPEHFYSELIESYPCKSKDELKTREGHYIRERGTYNIEVAGRTHEQWCDDNKEHRKEYHKSRYEANRERILRTHGDNIQCQCGKAYTFGHKARHERCKRHQQYVSNQTDEF